MNNGLIKNKKSVLALAGLLIVIFHLWINIFSGSNVELFIRTTSYLGVDMFFFLSAYSLGCGRIDNIPRFYLSRLKAVYVKFAFFVVIQALLASWSIGKVVRTLIGYELVEKGGGSFLWFLPAIMLLYLIMPFYQRVYDKTPVITAVLSFLMWFAVALLLTQWTQYRAGFIFWNRLPIFFIGFLCAKIPKAVVDRVKTSIWGLVLFLVGLFLLFAFGFQYKLQEPIWNMFYVLDMPAAIGLTLLADHIPAGRFVESIGSSTLEMYGVQMVIGYPLAELLLRLTGSAAITNLAVILIVIVISVFLNYLFALIHTLSKREKKAVNQP